MSYVPIYLPDGDIGVQWFVTEDKRADGVDGISSSLVRCEVGPRRDYGFTADGANAFRSSPLMRSGLAVQLGFRPPSSR